MPPRHAEVNERAGEVIGGDADHKADPEACNVKGGEVAAGVGNRGELIVGGGGSGGGGGDERFEGWRGVMLEVEGAGEIEGEEGTEFAVDAVAVRVGCAEEVERKKGKALVMVEMKEAGFHGFTFGCMRNQRGWRVRNEWWDVMI